MDFRQLIGDQSASDQQTQQPATTGVNFNALVKKVSPEVSTEPTPSLDVSKYIDKDKLDFAQTVAPIVGLHPYSVYSNADRIAKDMGGPKATTSTIKDTINDVSTNDKIAQLWAQQMQEGETPERDAEIKKLESQRKSSGKGVVPFIINSVATLGNQAFNLAKSMGAAKVAAAANMTAGLTGNPEAGQEATKAFKSSETDLIGSMVGGFYGDLREQGISPNTAKAAAKGMIVAQAALNLLPIKGLSVGMDALGEAFLKTAGKGILTKIAVQAGKSYATQGAIATINGVVSATIPALAESLDGKIKNGQISREDAEKVLGQFVPNFIAEAKKAGPGVLLQTLVFGTLGAGAAAFKGARVEIDAKRIADEIDKTPEVPSEAPKRAVAASPEQEGASPLPPEAAADAEAQAEAQRTKLAKETLAATPIGNLDAPLVPRETATSPSILSMVDKNKGVQGIRKLLAADPENPGLKGALATAEDQAAKDALEKQAVVVERERKQAVQARRDSYEQIGALHTPLKTADTAFDGLKPIAAEFHEKGMKSATIPNLDSVRGILTDSAIHIQDGATLAKGLEGLDNKPYWELNGAQRKALADATAAVGKTAQRYKKVFAQGKAVDEQAAYEMIKKSMRDPIPLATQMEKGPKNGHSGLSLAANAARSSITQYQTMSEMMFGRDSLGYQVTTGAVDDGVDRQMHLQRNWADPMRKDDPISKLYKDSKINPDKHNEEEIVLKGVYQDELNRPQDLKVTRDMLVSAEMHHSDTGNWDSFLNGVGVEGTKNPHHPMKLNGDVILKAIDSTLDKTDRARIAKMKELLEGEIYDETNKTHVALNGYDMDHSDTYWPRERIPGSTEGIIDDAINNGIEKHNYYMGVGVDKSATKPRVKSTAPIYWKSASSVWAEHTRWASHYAALGEAIDQAGRVVSDPRFKAALDDRYGPGNTYQKSFVDSLNRIAGKHGTYADVAKAVLAFNNKGVASVMGLNLHAAIRNSVLSSRVRAYVPEVDYQIGKYEATRHPVRTYRDLEANSDYFHSAKDSLRTNMTTAPSKFQELTGAPVKAGVTYAYMKEMTAAKHFALRRFNEGGLKDTSYDSELKESTKDKDHPMGLANEDIKNLSPEAKQKYATKYAEYVSKRTHLSPSPVYQAIGKLSGDPLAILTNTLGGEGLAATNMLMRSATEISHSTNPKAGRRLAKTILTLGVVAPLTDYALKYGWAEARGKPLHTPIDPSMTEKERQKADTDFVASYLTSLAEDLPGGRGVASALFGPMQSSLTPPGMVGQMASDAVSFAKDLGQAMNDKTSRSRDKAIKRAIDATFGIAAQLTGVPYAGLKSLGLSPISVWDYLNGDKP